MISVFRGFVNEGLINSEQIKNTGAQNKAICITYTIVSKANRIVHKLPKSAEKICIYIRRGFLKKPLNFYKRCMILSIFKGLCTALVTPFCDDGSVDFFSFGNLEEENIKAGADALLVCGTTGENACMKKEEQIGLAGFAVKNAKWRVPVICYAGSNNTEKAVYMAQRTALMGADALLLITPYYNRCSREGLYRHFKAAAESVDIPCIVYNVPGRTGLDISSEDYERLLNIKNIAGIKEASGSLKKAKELVELSGERADVYSGSDDLNIPVMKLGGSGAISVLSNIIPGEMKRIMDMCLGGNFDEAENIYKKYRGLASLLFKEVNPIPVKYCLYLMGLLKPNYRLPLCRPDEELAGKLKNELIAGGIIND